MEGGPNHCPVIVTAYLIEVGLLVSHEFHHARKILILVITPEEFLLALASCVRYSVLLPVR